MPKRILDDSLLDSRSLEVLSPRAQDAFPRFILIADDFGCFEVNPRVLWARGWSRRPDVSEADVAAWIVEYAERQAVDPETGKRLAPVLMLWTHVGRRYAYLTGWHGPHGQKRRDEYGPTKPHGSKRKTPPPPGDLLAAVQSGDVRAIDGKPPGTDREPTGNEDTETPNDSGPARETTGEEPGDERGAAGKCTVPAPAVPVAVPVAAASAAAAPVDAEPVRRLEVVDLSGPHDDPDPFPLTTRFRTRLMEACARTTLYPVGGGRAGDLAVFEGCERALKTIDVEEAVALCRQRVIDAVARGERQPGTLKFFVSAVLGDELTKRASQPKRKRWAAGENGQPVEVKA